jgi:hypothetical protein
MVTLWVRHSFLLGVLDSFLFWICDSSFLDWSFLFFGLVIPLFWIGHSERSEESSGEPSAKITIELPLRRTLVL